MTTGAGEFGGVGPRQSFKRLAAGFHFDVDCSICARFWGWFHESDRALIVFIFKSLVIVLSLGLVASLAGAKPFSIFLSSTDYRRAWWVLLIGTLAAFSTPSTVLLLMMIGLLGLVAANKLDRGPAGHLAVYGLLLAAMPPVSASLDGVAGLNRLIDLNVARVLSVSLLLGPAFRLLAEERKAEFSRNFIWMDLAVVGYVLLNFFIEAPDSSPTNMARLLVQSAIDSLIPYYVLSRGVKSREDIRFIMGYLVVGFLLAAAVAIGEFILKWNFYTGLQMLYGISWQVTLFLLRGDLLRAQAMAPQPIILAFMLMFGAGLWVWLAGQKLRQFPVLLVLLVLLGGLFATLSRGPWLGAAAFWLSMFALWRFSVGTYRFMLFGAVLTFVVVKVLGADEMVMSVLSGLFGRSEDDLVTIDYRRQLLDTAVALIQQSPWLGVRDYTSHMEHLRQGEGIIDLVNSYVGIALASGLVGLALYLLPFLIAFGRLTQAMAARPAGQRAVLGEFEPVFLSLIVAALLTIFTASTFGIMPFLLLILAVVPVAWLSVPVDAPPARVRADRRSWAQETEFVPTEPFAAVGGLPSREQPWA